LTSGKSYPQSGFVGCGVYSLGVGVATLNTIIIAASSTFMLFIGLFISKDFNHNIKVAVGLLYFIAIPTMDYFTDLAFLLLNKFYNFELLLASAVFFMTSSILFAIHLYERGAAAKLYVLSIPYYAAMNDGDSIARKCFCVVISLAVIVINAPVTLFIFMLGSFLHSTNCIAINAVGNIWMQLWTGTDNFQQDIVALNESIYLHIIWETIPQLVINISNTYYMNLLRFA